MNRPPALPDLDALDPAALKAIIFREQGAGSREQGAGSREQGAGSREQGAGSREQGAGSRERGQHAAALASHTGEIEHLKLIVEKLRRMLFGAKSEKTARQFEQLELRLEELESAAVQERRSISAAAWAAVKPTRRPLPEHLPREVHIHKPDHDACPDCGGALRPLGEDVAEVLEYVPASFKVIRHVRPRLSCGSCDRILQPAAPARPIERGLAGPGLLAHVLVSKYADH